MCFYGKIRILCKIASNDFLFYNKKTGNINQVYYTFNMCVFTELCMDFSLDTQFMVWFILINRPNSNENTEQIFSLKHNFFFLSQLLRPNVYFSLFF